MTIKLRYFLTVLFGICISGIALAADIGPDSVDQMSFLRPPLTDKSISYLSQLFGTVGTVLHGTSGQLLGKIFEVFNLGILAIAAVFATYTIFKSVLGTAQDGEFMGKQAKSGFVAIRTCLGVGLLAPVFTGYSAIQVLVMFVVVHGVGFADAAWGRALKYISETGQVSIPPQDEQTQKMLSNSAYFLSAYTCTEASRKADEKLNQDIKEAREKSGEATLQPLTKKHSYVPFFDKNTPVYNFPGGVGSNYGENKCGSIKYTAGAGTYTWNITWSPTDSTRSDARAMFTFSATSSNPKDCEKALQDINQEASFRAFKIDQAEKAELDDAYQACIKQVGSTESNAKEGIIQMALNLRPVAHDLIYSEKFPTPPVTTGDTFSFLNNRIVAALIGSAADFVNITLAQTLKQAGPRNNPTFLTKSQMEQKAEKIFKQSIRSGWISAGGLYYQLAQIQRKEVESSENLFKAGTLPPSKKEDYQTNFGFTSPEMMQRAAEAVQSIGNPTSEKNTYLNAAIKVTKEQEVSNKQDLPQLVLPKELGPLNQTLSRATNVWRNYLVSRGDPILGLQMVGFLNMNIAGTIFVSSLVIAGITSLLSTTALGTGAPGTAVTIMMTILPAIYFFIASFYATGITMAVYLPLVPFMIFIFGAIGWVISVMEAMVAGPLVALGITHPDGQHDLLGKSEAAVMFLLAVFLRPVLMVIGMLGGMILSNIGLRMINVGFNAISEGTIALSGISFIVVQIMMQFVYVAIIIAVVNQAYSLIYHIPDKVLRWMGAPEAGLGKPEGIGRVEQASGESAKEIGAKTHKTGVTASDKAWGGTKGKIEKIEESKKTDLESDE